MSKLSRWLPFLTWPRPDAHLLRNEGIAAITVAVVMIPQSVAYAGLAGMPLVTGLYATFLPALAAVLFSASTRPGMSERAHVQRPPLKTSRSTSARLPDEVTTTT